MGVGDWLMASGEARRAYEIDGMPSLIVGAHGRVMWSEVFEGVPYILKRPIAKPYHRLVNGGGRRPYIAAKAPEKWTWRPYKPTPAQLFFTTTEMAFAAPFRGMVMIEPNVKNVGHDNKAWVRSRWGEVIDEMVPNGNLADSPFVQCVAPGERPLDDVVHWVVTPTFRQAAAVLSVCRAFVGTDGGLMHAAAAVGVPAVILWSEFTSPDICGYASMVNLRHAGKPCGNRTPCEGCRKAMEAITVAEVVAALESIL